MENKLLNIKGMHCKSCVDLIEKELKTLEGIAEVKVDLIKEQAFIRFDSAQVTLDVIKEKIKEIGYRVGVEDKTDNDSRKTIRINVRNKKILILALCSVFLIVAVLTKGFGLIQPNLIIDDFINIPLSEITSTAKWYEYEYYSGGNKIKFFAVKASDGTIKTAFDACDVCYYAKKGYRQEGDYMVCNNCGNRYPIAGLGIKNKTPGGCWPGYLPSIAEGDNILIKKSDLESNRWRSL